jgi:hypothetical protein
LVIFSTVFITKCCTHVLIISGKYSLCAVEEPKENEVSERRGGGFDKLDRE